MLFQGRKAKCPYCGQEIDYSVIISVTFPLRSYKPWESRFPISEQERLINYQKKERFKTCPQCSTELDLTKCENYISKNDPWFGKKSCWDKIKIWLKEFLP